MRNDYKIDDSVGTSIEDKDGMDEILYYLQECKIARIERAKKDVLSAKILCGVSTLLAVVGMGIAGRCALQVKNPNVSPDARFVEKIQEFEKTEYYQQFKQQYFENNDATLCADNINTNMLQNHDTKEYQNEKEEDAQRACGICGIVSMGVLAVASLIVAKEAGDNADYINKYIQHEEKESNKTSIIRDKENEDALNELDCDTDKENERW